MRAARAFRFVPPVFLLALATTLSAGVVSAANEHRPAGRFDDRIRPLDGGSMVVLPRSLEQLDLGDDLRVAWDQFRQRNGGGWKVYLDERTGMPVMAKGSGVAWMSEAQFDVATLDEMETAARAFLADQAELLGDWSSWLLLDRRASGKIRDRWQLVFRQEVDGVLVEDARLEMQLKRGRLIMYGAINWGLPRVSALPSLDADKAREMLDAYLDTSLDGFEPLGEPQLVLRALDADAGGGESRAWAGPRGEGVTHALIWRLSFRDPGGPATWVGEVDAHDGSVRAFYDNTQYSTVRGGVFPISPLGDCSEGGCEIAGFPMPFADYTESGQTEEYADAWGNLACADPGATFETRLAGPYVVVDDLCGATLESGSCDEGLDLGLKQGVNCVVAPGASAGNTAAARTSYYHLNRIAEMTRFYDPANVWLNSPVTVNVNMSGSCNANWNGEINMNGEGGNCSNTGESHGVLVHEWGHGYDYNDGGDADKPGEAYADIVSILYARQSCVDPGFRNDGTTCSGYGDTCLTCTGLRDHDWAARLHNTPTTPIDWAEPNCPDDFTTWAGPCRKEPHCEAYPVSEAIYDFATRDLPAAGLDQDTAWQLAERLWYETRLGSSGEAYRCWLPYMSESCEVTHWYQRMLAADDDDGNLANGTPHAAALYAAFARHELACGSAGDSENQSTSSCPTLAAPALSVVETPQGTQLSWGAVSNAAEYRVYRGDLGCDRQQVGLADLPGGQTSYLDDVSDQELPRYYRVEAIGANPACHGPVSNCAATPLTARLQQHAHQIIELGPDAPNGIPEPGETVSIPLALFNSGLEASSGTAGTVRLVGPGQVRVLEPDAVWSSIPPNNSLETSAPHFELVVQEDAACGDTIELELDAWASNSAPVAGALQIRMGEPNRDFINDVDRGIPLETTAPVTSAIVIDQDQTLSELDVSVRISHGVTEELIVELTSPEGTTVRLHDQTTTPENGVRVRYDLERDPDGPGTMGDFVGESTQGTWTLSIEDVGSASTGTGSLYDWTLYTTIAGGWDCQPRSCAEPPPADAPDLQVELAADDLVLTWNSVAAIGYHVLQSSSADYSAGVELLERTPTGTSHTVVGGVQGTPALTFFQVRGVNSCNHEGP